MVVRTAKNGFKYREPPYSEEELRDLERFCNSTPVAMIGRRRGQPDTGSQRPAAEGSAATPDQTPNRS
jgi:hypothetical protein